MNASCSRLLAAAAALLLLALAPAPALATLERVGPNSPTNFLPTWYQDHTGLAFEFCTPLNQAEYTGGWCLLLPGTIPGDVVPEVFPGAFFNEHFFWASDNKGNYAFVPTVANPNPAANSGKVTLTMAIESAFLGVIGPGLGGTFGRIRIKVTPLPITGTYRVYTPFSVQDIPGIAGDKIFATHDVGITCAAFTYDCALQTEIGPFLVPSNTPGGSELPPVAGPVPGKLYLSDPARVGPVTGSPNGQYTLQSGRKVNANVFLIEAPDGQVIYESYDFTTMGRIMTDVIPSRLAMNRASYAQDAGGIRVDAFATGEPTLQPRLPAGGIAGAIQPQLSFFDAPCGGTLDVNGVLQPPYTAPAGQPAISMTHAGNVYWGSAAPAAVPAGVCLVDLNAHDAGGAVVPAYVPGTLGDQVFVTAAVYDPSNGGSLSVRASSSDQIQPPVLSLGAFGDLAANVPLANDLAYVTPLAAPPATVRVLSQEGGVAELQVKIGSRAATGVTLTADKASPQPPGTAVVFTAQGAGATEYLYRFWLHDGTSWSVAQDWSASANWVLPTSTVPGSYQVKVDVWAGLQPSAPDATSSVIPFVIVVEPATGVSLVSSLPSPQLPGTAISFTAAGSGSSSPYSYQFWLLANGTWTIVQGWSPAATWALPTNTPAGSYQVIAQVRTSPTVAVDATSSPVAMVLGVPPATGVSLTPSLASPQAPGTAVTFTAAGQGSTASYSYRFWLYDGATWAVVQDWNATSTWTLANNTPAGNYQVAVEVRTSTSVARDAISPTIPFQLVASPATGVTLTPDLASPQPQGTAVVFTAAGQGSTAAYSYRFWLNDGATWTVVRDWNAGATWTLPNGTLAGAYSVAVEVRTSTTVARDAISSIVPFVIFVSPATGVSLTPSLASPQLPGTTVKFTAAGSGSTATYSYRFWLFDGVAWAVVQDWNTADNWTLPGTTPEGDYQVAVEVRTSTTVARDAISPNLSFSVAIPPATGVTLTPGATSPQPPGTPVLFTAAGTGSTAPYSYRFWLFDGATWTMVQDWSATATWTLPNTTLAGSYAVAAEVRTSTRVSRDAISPITPFDIL